METKKSLYKTAIWLVSGECVKLVKYHRYGNYYDIETIAGDSYRVQECELDRFVL